MHHYRIHLVSTANLTHVMMRLESLGLTVTEYLAINIWMVFGPEKALKEFVQFPEVGAWCHHS